ncbi:MAG: hypothetical protein EOO15_12095 [Chitinophagaceae bacterium]|nr:MAG: hypothetical protein EOO15_12095 [Chitinophagaceae bacterium]
MAGSSQPGSDSNTLRRLRFLYFPLSPKRAWTVGVGVTATTMPYEITEELHYQIPALEVSVLRRVGNRGALYGRASIQGFQNLISIGPRVSFPLTSRMSLGLGDDVAFWFGFNNFEGFKTQATGWQNFPNLTVGYRFNKQVLLSVRAEMIMTIDIRPKAGDIKINSQYNTFSGSAYTVMLEQPFYGRKRMALGLRAAYTSFFWQTWSAFSTYERNFFYPQLIACVTF